MLFRLQLLLLFLYSGFILGQGITQLKVLDSNEKLPLAGAHVCVVNIDGTKEYYSANIDGEVKVNIAKQAEMTISYVGYITKMIATEGNENLTISLVPDLLELNQVIVTASVKPQKIDQSIYKVDVISAATMEKQGVQNVRDALRFQPSVNLIEDGVLGSQIIMQGLEGQHVKFLIDGVPIIGRQDGNVDLSQIDMSQVDHVEIIEGPMSVVYGSNALAGTINIITKQNKYYKWIANVNTYAESVGQLNTNVSVLGNIGKSKLGISGGYRYFNGYDLDETTRTMSWSPKNQINSDVFYGLDVKGWEAKTGVRFSLEDLNYKGDFLIPNRAIDTEFITKRISYYGSFNKEFSEHKVFSGLLSYNVYSRTSQEYIAKTNLNIFEEKGDVKTDLFNTINARLSYSHDFTNWLLWQIGYELTNETGEGAKVKDNEGLMENAIWSDLKIKLSKKLLFQPGVRYIHHTIYDAPVILSTHLKWNPNTSWQSRISVAKGFRAPSMKELYMDFVDTNHKIYGNENLIPETSYNITATVSKTILISDKSVLKIDATGFNNHLTDVIELASGDDGVSYLYKNISEKKTHGGTFGINYQYNFFKLNLGAALTGIGYDLYGTSDFDFQYATDFTAITIINLRKFNISMELDYKYTDKRSQLYANGSSDEITVGTVDGYHMLNFSVSKDFKNSRFSLTAGAKNILDVESVNSSTQSGAHSSSSGRLIAWGRTYFVALKYNFKKI